MPSFAICVESSHKKGMGHLFRALCLAELLALKGSKVVIVLNDDKRSTALLNDRKMYYETADLSDPASCWEAGIIKKHGIDIWINDRLDTTLEHARNVKKLGVPLVSLDDLGGGSEIADMNFGTMPFNFNAGLKGKKVFKGLEYLILNKEIDEFKRERDGASRIVVTLGGSDTYGVTLKIVKILKKSGRAATVIVGPCFAHRDELRSAAGGAYEIVDSPFSIFRELHRYDLAITGGGITPFEANASGLPCIVVANERHEVANGIFLQELGSSVFAGYHEDVRTDIFNDDMDIRSMSRRGMERIKTGGAENIYNEMSDLWKRRS